ncbi:MAG TPA: membrane protein insertase YidC [Pyrinomonadaceae bacterium]|nr:membrane protein insertase YidC [Pyrinomonadaceae bacterium]
MQQKRLIIALLISTAILFVWGYFVPTPQTPKPGPTPSPSAAATLQSAASPDQSPVIQATPAASPNVTPATVVNAAPRRNIVIKTPLFDAKFDSQGAEAISWIIRKNKDTNNPIYSVGGTKQNPMPLELISAEGLNRQPRQAPLQLLTADASLNQLLMSSSYAVEGVDGSGDAEVSVGANESKRITFRFSDPATGVEVTKTIVVDGNSYDADLEISITRGGQAVPAKLRVGPSIGDQGIKHYTFYSVAPEGVASVGNPPEVARHFATSINSSSDKLDIGGPVDWGAVGDTYFAMAAIPARSLDGLQLTTTQYNHEVNGTRESRFLIDAWVPVPTDGSRTVLYAGPKDHFIITETNSAISQAVGRSIDLEGLIDYGWFSWMSKPLAVPILKAIKWLKQLTGNYGIAIILFTIIIYSLFFPLKWRSSKAMKKAQKLAPKMKELQDKIKGMKPNDPRLKELQVEQLRLMKEGNPLGGCLPLLLQMPFLFALYRAITISLDFRQATFLWLPDLSAGDPYHILEFLMSGTMIVLQLITPAPSADPLQRKMMAIGMPLFMLYVLWGAPSGLLLYWLVGNIVGFSQQFIINRLTRSEDDEPPPADQKTKGSKKRSAAPQPSQA